MDCSLPGFSVHGILQARTLEWVAIFFSNACKWKVSEVAQSCLTLSDPMDCSLPGSSVHGIFQATVLEWDAIACVVYYCPNTWSSDEIKSYGTDKNRPWEPRVVLGQNGRPLNSSHFRNSKCLEIDKVVSEKEREGKKDEKEGGREDTETIEEMLAHEKAWLRKKWQTHKKKTA